MRPSEPGDRELIDRILARTRMFVPKDPEPEKPVEDEPKPEPPTPKESRQANLRRRLRSC